MSTSFCQLCAVQMYLLISGAVLPPSPPTFSWDTVPLFIHAQNQSGPLNETAAKYMASFPLATIAHGQAADGCPPCSLSSQICEEDRIITALQQIRSYSPETRTIFYLHSYLNLPLYNLSTKFLGENEQYLLHDQNGELIYLQTACGYGANDTLFDLSQNETINFWLQTVEYAMTAQPGVVDGVFADEAQQNISQYAHCINMTGEFQQAWNAGHTYMLQEAQRIISKYDGERGILIANNADIAGVNGRMFENYRYDDTWASNADGSRDDLIALMAEKGKRVIEVHGEDYKSYGDAAYNITLAAYLIGAVEYSYYAYSNGWTLQDGWDQMLQNPDYHKSLGSPLGEAVYDNTSKVYSRQFASGTKVWMDAEWNYPCIRWSDHTVTGNVSDCSKYLHALF